MSAATIVTITTYIYSIGILVLWDMREISYEGAVLAMLMLIAILVAAGIGEIIER